MSDASVSPPGSGSETSDDDYLADDYLADDYLADDYQALLKYLSRFPPVSPPKRELYPGLVPPTETEAAALAQHWPRKMIPEAKKRVVVYTCRSKSSPKTDAEYEKIQSIFTDLGVQVDYRSYVDGFSLFSAELKRFSAVNIVFIGGRYIGGINQLIKLNVTGDLLKLLMGLPLDNNSCHDCGGYKYILSDKVKGLMSCSLCNDKISASGLNSVLKSNETKLRICFEAKNPQGQHVYLIYSVEGSWLATQRSHPPTFEREAVILGNPSMGCGIYDSMIVLAGGVLQEQDVRYNGCITFNMSDNEVCYTPFPPMKEGKFKPLVFQLNKRLYVFDTEHGGYPRASFEFFTTSLEQWGKVVDMFNQSSRRGPVNYSCLIIGNSCFMSYPHDPVTRVHHSNYLGRYYWMKHPGELLPFSGVANFYHQDGFDDFVVIYFEKGAVSARPFDFYKFGDSKYLFRVDSDTGGEDMHGHFADFGDGCFCLTAFNKSSFYIYTFKITRPGKKSDKAFHVDSSILTWYKIDFASFSTQGNIESVVGCFAPAPNKEANLHAEELAAKTLFKDFEIREDA